LNYYAANKKDNFMKRILFAFTFVVLGCTENLLADTGLLQIHVKCELVKDIRSTGTTYLGSHRVEPAWSAAVIRGRSSTSADTPPFHTKELQYVRPGEFLLTVPKIAANRNRYVKFDLLRSLRFPYEGQVILKLDDQMIQAGDATVNLKGRRMFTRRISRFLRHKETGNAVVEAEIVLMKHRSDGRGTNQVASTTTDSEGFFQFLIWDDWKYSLHAKGAFQDFGVVNDPKPVVIDWIPNNISEDAKK